MLNPRLLSPCMIISALCGLCACDDEPKATQEPSAGVVGGLAGATAGAEMVEVAGGGASLGSDLGSGGERSDLGVEDATLSCELGAPLRCVGPRHLALCVEEGAEEQVEPCPPSHQCVEGRCQPVTCASDGDCLDDSACVEGQCAPYPAEGQGDPSERSNERCGLALNGAAFAPEVQCRWTAGEVSGQPLVIDLDQDGVPEVLVVSGGNVIALSGETCQERARSQGLLLSGESSLAAGDIDADGAVEVVAMSGFGAVVALNSDLTTQWNGVTRVFGIASAPAIADLDGDGLPEVIAGGTALNGEDGSLHARSAVEPTAHGFGPIPAVADVDGDGQQEVLYGNRIFNARMEDVTPSAMASLPPGHVAVANFEPETPEPELAVISGTSYVRVQRLSGEVIFGPYQVPSSVWAGGAPNVADFDGDGRPEIGTAGSHNFAVFDLACQGEPLPEGCEAEGIRWTRSSRDGSSGATGSTTFDFDGDGRVEVVYNDECFLRVYDGSTGEVLLALANSTGTLIEAPLVADADGDGRSELIVSSDQGFPCDEADTHTGAPPAQTQGLTIIRDASERWVRSRPIWNQNAYAITNVNNDGSIPAQPEPSWGRFNSFRENLQPDGKAHEAPDLTALGVDVVREGCGVVTLVATLSNRGAQPVSPGLRFRFYLADQGQGELELCAGETRTRLLPGSQEEVSCLWRTATDEGGIVWVEVDPIGDPMLPAGGRAECVETNNRSTLWVPPCVDP